MSWLRQVSKKYNNKLFSIPLLRFESKIEIRKETEEKGAQTITNFIRKPNKVKAIKHRKIWTITQDYY